MKKYTLSLFVLAILNLPAQEKIKDYSKNVATLDSTIETLYTVISGDKGFERDWALFKHLFWKLC